MGVHYSVPVSVDQSQVVDLTPETQHRAELKPTSLVVCINRGPKVIRDMFDAQTYEIPPYAKFRVEHQVAAHLQRRNIVAGTKNPDPGDSSAPQFVPWIAIIGLDPPSTWEPFTDEELALFGESAEGLAPRAGTTVMQTAELRRQLPGLGIVGSAAMSGTTKPDQQIHGGTEETRAAALEKVVGSDAVTTSAEALASGWTPPPVGAVEETSAPQPRPLASAKPKRK